MLILQFLLGAGVDASGRTLKDVWAFPDVQIEHVHTFIQWVFPTAEKSRAVPRSPVLDGAEIAAIRASAAAKANLKASARWYLDYLKRNTHWIRAQDHNHLRMIRMLKSLHLLVGDDAVFYHDQFWRMIGAHIAIIPKTTILHWQNV